jgi:hypothetical protein
MEKRDLLKMFKEWRKGGIKENDGGVNSTMIYCKNLGECHNLPQYNKKKLKRYKDIQLLKAFKTYSFHPYEGKYSYFI